jgi:hypothetical protein
MRGNDLAGVANHRTNRDGHAGTGLTRPGLQNREQITMSERATAPTRGKRTLTALLLLAGGTLAATGTANAQGFARSFFDDDILPPRVVAWRLADRGFTGVSRPRFDGRVYIVDAVGPAGVPVRLILDPATGAIIDRQRLPGTETYARLERPPVRTMPGYGWTEEDARPLPPPEPGPVSRLPRRPTREAVRPPVETNPLGLNPEGSHRQEPRKVARANAGGVAEKSLSRVSPLAPAPKLAPETVKPEATKPESAAPAADAKPAVDPSKDSPASAAKPVAQAVSKPEWKDPPAEGKRPVRVIGGATVVPGTPGKEGEPAAAQP